jgi:hypothetical protein
MASFLHCYGKGSGLSGLSGKEDTISISAETGRRYADENERIQTEQDG